MRFSPAQQQAIDIRDKNVLVFASAGSGKTSVLVQRLCQLVLKDKISIDSILAMTFTNDAANEMKSRLKISLENAAASPYIEEQLALLETASICTIDSFCLSIVQNYYYRIPISYKMSRTIDDTIQRQAFEQAFQQACFSLPVQKMANLYLFFSSFGKKEEDIKKSLETLIQTAWSKPEPEDWIQSLIHKPSSLTDNWFFRYFDQYLLSMDVLLQEMILQTEAEELLAKKEALQPCLNALHQENYELFKQSFLVYLSNSVRLKNKYDDIDTKAENEAYKKAEKKITDLLFDADFYQTETKDTQELKETFCTLALTTQKFYAQIKKEKEMMDFGDMEHFAYQLLCQKDIAQEVQNKYKMILVDEFQDTNDLQESILSCFARKNNVFRVGDIKQSIYGFRHAKPEIMKHHMEKQDEFSCTLVLDENYRSNASIIHFNNDFYQKIMNVDGMSKQFDQKDIARPGTKAQEEREQYPIRFLYTESDMLAEQENISKIEAKSIARENKLDILAHDILKHKEKGVSFKDICILTRSHGPQEEIKKALEAYDIPVLAEIDHGFYTNASIQIVLSCLEAIVDPYNDIALCATLFSPFCQIQPDQLAQACLTKEKGTSLYMHLKDSALMQDFFTICKWKQDPVPLLIRKLYAWHDFYESHTSAQDKTNLDLFLQFASQLNDTMDLENFLQQHVQAARFDSLSEAYPYEKEADVVSIKTMHHSKGLQFPIVYVYSQHETKDRISSEPVIVDEKLGIGFLQLDAQRRIKLPSKAHLAIRTKKLQDELEEEMRVFYVATTRAEKELILLDSISSAKNYEAPLSLQSLLKRQSYTSWIFHAYYHKDSGQVHFERIQNIYTRPVLKQQAKKQAEHPIYNKKTLSLTNATATLNKQLLQWPDIDLDISNSMQRGTLFHEMAATLSYPYQKEELQHYATEHGYDLTSYDLQLLQALNQNQEYALYMKLKHRFECPYIIKADENIVHGFMDLVVWNKEKIIIIDFKTDHLEHEEEFIERYSIQLETYQKAMKQIENKSIDTKIYSFYLRKFISVHTES